MIRILEHDYIARDPHKEEYDQRRTAMELIIRKYLLNAVDAMMGDE